MKIGAALYYASDKNIFDALNQSKVDAATIQDLFRRRNIVCSKRTKREDLAEFFSRLTHDLSDHRELSDCLGVVPRRERVTSVDLVGKPPDPDGLQSAVDALRDKLSKQGDVVNVHQDGDSTFITVSYTVIDYKRSEFSQMQNRTGVIEVVRHKGKLVVRSPKSDYLDEVRDELVRQIEAETPNALDREEISLFSFPDPAIRSQFFYELMTDLPGYERKDVTGVFVFKPRPEDADELEIDEEDDNGEPHVEKIWLKGSGVTQSELLQELIKEKAYYIAKVAWIANMKLGVGGAYEVEATFANPKDCTGFSYLLRGVYERGEDAKLSKVRRSPTAAEINEISRVIEKKARELLNKLNSKPKGGE